MEWAVLEIPAVLFFASTIRSAFGFGEALVAVPLMALVIPIEVAAPLAVLVSITIALIAVAQDWRQIHVRSALWLVLSTLAGIPLGLLLLKDVPEAIVKAVLAVVIVSFSVYSLVGRKRPELKTDGMAWLFGFLAGVLGGAYGMNGPPLALYGSWRGWPPKHFRATLQGYFLPASVVGMCGYGLAGLWTPAVNRFYLWSLPLVVAAVFAGRVINRRLHPQRFLFGVHAGLIAIGAILLVQAAASRPAAKQGPGIGGTIPLPASSNRNGQVRMPGGSVPVGGWNRARAGARGARGPAVL